MPVVAQTAGRFLRRSQPRFQGALRMSLAILATARAVAEIKTGQHRLRLLQAWSARVLRALRIEVVVEGNLPAGARLWAANHLSWLDPLVLLSLRPSGVLAKREVASYPVVGSAAAGAGVRFVERDDPMSRAAALFAMVVQLRRGGDFLLFPEGTTTRGHHLGQVHSGGLLMAHRLNVPTLPLRLDCGAAHYPWTGDESLLPHLQTLAAGPPVQVRIKPGPCLHPQDFSDPYEWLTVLRHHLAPVQRADPEPSI